MWCLTSGKCVNQPRCRWDISHPRCPKLTCDSFCCYRCLDALPQCKVLPTRMRQWRKGVKKSSVSACALARFTIMHRMHKTTQIHTHMICNISSAPEQRCESALTLNNTGTFLHTYLGGAHSLDVYVRLQSEVHSWGELGDAQLFRGELHCCHLLAVVGWHNVLKQDQHSVGVVGSQKIQAGAPLEHKAKRFQSELPFLTSFHLCLI